ncbi:MAG TPA: FkbM family methyltransferase [Candidatus Acidoferrales bacterium]|nr:FkbM family methyltransferase [Candidatus Acidoferrales bacterium]
MKPGQTFIDIGAHIGQYSLIAAGTGLDVHCFEPDEKTFQLLQANIAQNRLTRVTANRAAVSATAGRVPFYPAAPTNIGNSSLRPQSYSTGEEITVECVRLDSYVKDHNVQNICLIKIDVEGAECDALEGAEQTIERWRPAIAMELSPVNLRVFGRNTADVTKWFGNRDFSLYTLGPSGLERYKQQETEPEFENIIALPSEFPSPIDVRWP